jgi:hypothetical protein
MDGPSDLELAMQAVRLFDKAFSLILEDLVRSKIDMRAIKKETRDYIMMARAKRDELLRRRELEETEMIQPKKDKH